MWIELPDSIHILFSPVYQHPKETGFESTCLNDFVLLSLPDQFRYLRSHTLLPGPQLSFIIDTEVVRICIHIIVSYELIVT